MRVHCEIISDFLCLKIFIKKVGENVKIKADEDGFSKEIGQRIQENKNFSGTFHRNHSHFPAVFRNELCQLSSAGSEERLPQRNEGKIAEEISPHFSETL